MQSNKTPCKITNYYNHSFNIFESSESLKKNKVYYKITNSTENHHGFQYKDGLNVLIAKFNNDRDASCVPGGLYFTDIEHIFEFLSYGVYLWEITLPTNDTSFKIIKDRHNKWRANKIIFGKRYNLDDVETFKYLDSQGADIHYYSEFIMEWALRNGYSEIAKYLISIGVDINEFIYTIKRNIGIQKWDFLKFLVDNGIIVIDNDFIKALVNGNTEIVKYLVHEGADIHSNNDYAITYASRRGYLEIVKFLVSNGADIHVKHDYAVRHASEKGHLDIIKFLTDQGADIHADNEYAIRWASANGRLEVVKFLFSKGVNINYWNDCAIRGASKNGHSDVVIFLTNHGANIHADNEYALRWASINGHLQVVEFLVDHSADIRANNDYAIKHASKENQLDVIDFLVDRGAIIPPAYKYSSRWRI